MLKVEDLSTEPLDRDAMGMQPAAKDWEEPGERILAPAGVYACKLADIRKCTSGTYKGRSPFKGKPYWTFVVDLEVASGPYRGAGVVHWFGTYIFRKTDTSDLKHLFGAAGLDDPTKDEAQTYKVLERMVKSGTPFGGKLDWRGRCAYRERKLKLAYFVQKGVLEAAQFAAPEPEPGAAPEEQARSAVQAWRDWFDTRWEALARSGEEDESSILRQYADDDRQVKGDLQEITDNCTPFDCMADFPLDGEAKDKLGRPAHRRERVHGGFRDEALCDILAAVTGEALHLGSLGQFLAKHGDDPLIAVAREEAEGLATCRAEQTFVRVAKMGGGS